MSDVPPFATAEEVERELRRVSDRLRVVGPRLAARSADDSRALLTSVREGLQTLADLARDGDGGGRRPVPELGPHALGDQALVLGHDVLEAAAAAVRADDDGTATALLGEAHQLLLDLRRLL